mmetsp:Transcript_1778/g.2362  ORF Transcript_1778/g.2362 Transcript_1778/m.2362 type:complete len:367 (-) Transcript_1778:1242-2342(-)
MSCVKVGRLVPPCGAFGSCVNGSVCVCDNDSWSQNSEWSFFVDDITLTEVLPCNTNEKIIKAFYALIGIIALICFTMHMIIVRSRKKFIKRLSLYIGLVGAAFMGFLRVSDHTRLYGQDVPFSIIWAVVYFMVTHQSVVYNKKFLEFQVQTISFVSESDRRKQFKKIQVLDYWIMYSNMFFFTPALFAVAFISRPSAYILIKVCFGLIGVFFLAHCVLDWILIEYFVKALESLLQSPGRGRVSTGSSNDKNDFLSAKNLKAKVSQLKSSQRGVLFFDILATFSHLAAAFSDFFMTLWIYYFPYLVFRFCLFVFTNGLPATIKRLKQLNRNRTINASKSNITNANTSSVAITSRVSTSKELNVEDKL